MSIGNNGGGGFRVGLTDAGRQSWLVDLAATVADAPLPIRAETQSKAAAAAAEDAIIAEGILRANAEAAAKARAEDEKHREHEAADLAEFERLVADDMEALSGLSLDDAH